MYYLFLPTLEVRQGLITHLRKRGIQGVFHYLPLHLSEMGRQFGGQPGACPVTERVSDQLVRLPFHNALTEQDLAKVVGALRDYDF
jgi:dTDP-4-amino-4,6-dideoxygalactose transaminase